MERCVAPNAYERQKTTSWSPWWSSPLPLTCKFWGTNSGCQACTRNVRFSEPSPRHSGCFLSLLALNYRSKVHIHLNTIFFLKFVGNVSLKLIYEFQLIICPIDPHEQYIFTGH